MPPHGKDEAAIARNSPVPPHPAWLLRPAFAGSHRVNVGGHEEGEGPRKPPPFVRSTRILDDLPGSSETYRHLPTSTGYRLPITDIYHDRLGSFGICAGVSTHENTRTQEGGLHQEDFGV